MKEQKENLSEYWSKRLTIIRSITTNPLLLDSVQGSIFISNLFEKVQLALDNATPEKNKEIRMFIFSLLTLVCSYGLDDATSMAMVSNIISESLDAINDKK